VVRSDDVDELIVAVD